MARPRSGSIDPHVCKDGSISYRARVRAYGRQEKVTLGNSKQGWNDVRAELELEKIIQQIERGTWVPPRLRAKADRLADAMVELGVDVDEQFRTFANNWWATKRLDLDENTVNDYEWRLTYLHRFFDRLRLRDIDVRVVDRFRDELRDQAETIRKAAERDKPMMETVTDKRGRTYQRRRKPLSNTSINMMLTLLGQILQQAFDYELIDRNPVRVGERFLPKKKGSKSFLEIDEFHALLDAAGELDRGARADQKIGRRPMLATLGLSGLRISELVDLRVATVDLHRARFKLPDSKTAAGIREVEITMFLLDELFTYVADRRSRGLPMGPEDYFFPTHTGRRRDPDRFRDRILARSVNLATERRVAAGLMPMPGAITPHALRRTWANFAAVAGRTPKWIASQIGHEDPRLAFTAYQQMGRRRYVDEAAIWRVMRFGDEPEERVIGRSFTRPNVPMNVPTGLDSDF
ncbi:MAG: tyrosine-type recombinase/integrase [Solirubrobacteraceae bacterium]